MKTKKFFMTSLLVMGMIIAKAANGFPPELVLVSQPVLTYNANSVTIYYDVQNIGDYTYRGDLYIYLDPDDGHCFAREYMRICPGRIRRFAVTIPAYRPNPSWVYTVMPYYELGGELYSFTTFEYFEPVRFCWNGYRNEPWVVIHVGPRPRYYHRPYPYRFYYDGYYPIAPPPPGGYPYGYFDGMRPLDPHHHTYHHHHSHGGYPYNYHPEASVPGYNSASEATVVRHGANTPGSMSSNDAANSNANNNGGATVVPRVSNNGNSGSMSTRGDESTNTTTTTTTTTTTGRTGTTGRNDAGTTTTTTTTRPSTTNNSGSVSRPSNSSSSSSSSRPSSNSNSGSVSRPSSNSNSSSSSSRPSSSSSSSSRSNSSSSRSNGSSSRGTGSTGGRR